MSKKKNLPEDTFSSPACSMNEFNGPYMGFLSNGELFELLTNWRQQETQATAFFASTLTKQQKEQSQKRWLVFDNSYQLLLTMDPSLSPAKNSTSASNIPTANNFENFEADLLQQVKSSLPKISQEPIRKLLESLLA